MVFFVLLQTVAFAATITSTATGGNWSAGSTWVGGVVPTSSDNVIIATGATVAMISTPVTIGTFTVSGQLVLIPNTTHVINTISLIVVSPSGSILFDKKSDIKLPVNTPLQVNAGGLLGSCSNNNSIFLGTVEVAVCVGGGNAIPTFREVMESGGYNVVNVSPLSDSSCGPKTFSFTAKASPSNEATIKWYTAPTGGAPVETGIIGNTSTYTPTVSTTTTYYVEAYYKNTLFATPRKAVTATVNSTSTPIVGAKIQPDCKTETGSVVLSGLPSSGTINQTGTVVKSYTITGTTMPITGLAAGTYNFTVTNSTGCSSSATGNVVINILKTATWTGSAWVDGPPTANQALEFSGDYNSLGDLTACSCKVTGSKNVVINSGHTLTITNELTVLGTLIFEDTASLIQTNNVTNTGDIIYKRNMSSPLTSDYTYWSSPVKDQKLDISDFYKSGMFYSYDDFATPEDWKPETAATIMKIGKGYIIRGPQIEMPPGLYFATFKGVPNNGPQSIAVSGGVKSTLIGNPYPSAIDADAFLSANSAAIDGTLYFWTHNTALKNRNLILSTAGSGALAYTSNDYAVYNLTGGVIIDGVTYVKGGTIAPNGGVKPTGKIAAGQSFFTTSTIAGGTVNFTNAMRVDGSGNALNNSNFFKTKNPNTKTASTIEKHRVWLNLSNTQGAFKQTLIGYLTDATNDYDSRFDGESFDGNEFVDFYSINQDKNLVIQGRALPFDENDEVPLGFRSTIEGSFTINIDQVDGLLANQSLFIEDKVTNTVFDLKSGNYTFKTVAGTFDDRFILRYTNKTLGTNELATQSNKVLISNKNKQIKINSFSETIDKVTIYDVLGRQIYQNGNVNSNEFLISNLVSSHQTLIVKTSLQNGKTVTDKIIY